MSISFCQLAPSLSIHLATQVPLLTDDNVDGFPCGTLVRYTGMVSNGAGVMG